MAGRKREEGARERGGEGGREGLRLLGILEKGGATRNVCITETAGTGLATVSTLKFALCLGIMSIEGQLI